MCQAASQPTQPEVGTKTTCAEQKWVQSGGGAVAKGVKKECFRTAVFFKNSVFYKQISIESFLFLAMFLAMFLILFRPALFLFLHFVPHCLFFVPTFCSALLLFCSSFCGS